MKLLTKAITKGLPKLGATEKVKDPTVHVKFFTPDSNWTWYVTEYDPQTETCFGLVQGFEEELGYFSLAELRGARGPMGLPIERDLYFDKCKLSEVRKNV